MRSFAGGVMLARDFTTWCPAGTSVETLVAVEGHRWAIEDSFETAKNELGLDHNETHSWHGWHRHVSLVMLAIAMMATIRHRANATTPPKTMRRTANHDDGHVVVLLHQPGGAV
jgi:SRSO17 transposase